MTKNRPQKAENFLKNCGFFYLKIKCRGFFCPQVLPTWQKIFSKIGERAEKGVIPRVLVTKPEIYVLNLPKHKFIGGGPRGQVQKKINWGAPPPPPLF